MSKYKLLYTCLLHFYINSSMMVLYILVFVTSEKTTTLYHVRHTVL